MKVRSFIPAIFTLLILSISSGCSNDSDTKAHSQTTCKGNPDACFGTQTCNTETGKCVPMSCKEDPKVCYKTEKCNAIGECVAKSCVDDPRVCFGTQTCDTNTGECIYKTCDLDPNVCHESETCNPETNKCMAKSCMDNPEICAFGQKCNPNGTCITTCLGEPSLCKENEKCTLTGECKPIKPCTDDPSVCGSEYLCEDGECYTIDSTYHTPDIPAFCEEKATIQFLIDNYEYIFNLLDALKDSHDNDSHDNDSPETEACDEYLDLEKLFNEQGSQVCKQLLSCSVGSSRSFMTCTSHFLNESFKHGSIKDYIKSLNIDPELINNLDNVNSYFLEKEYKLIHYILFKQFNGVTQKSICHTCTYDPSICTPNETCSNHNCIRKGKNFPNYCNNYLVVKFFLDHYEIYHDLMSNNSDLQTNAYQKLTTLYNLYLDDLCRQMGDECLFIDNDTMNLCAHNILQSIYTSDNLSEYLNNIAKEHESIQLLKYDDYLCNLYKDDCTAIVTANIAAFTAAINDEISTSFTCDNKPSICSDDNDCRYSECLDNKLTPLYCNYQSMRWFLLDHFDLINVLVDTDTKVACESYNQLLNIIKREGKTICHITSGCITGNDTNIMECVLDLLSKLAVTRRKDDFLDTYAPGYDQNKALSFISNYGDIKYNASNLSRLRKIISDDESICTE